jgi:peptidoglycan hydrolase-like protein with peptidoglycan-binding domain
MAAMSSVRINQSAPRFPLAQPAQAAGVVRAANDGFDARRPQVVLQRGSTGAGVRSLQAQLLKAGFLTQRDITSGPGVYGPRTEQGVRAFQRSVGLPETGVAGAATLSALSSGTRFTAAPASRAQTQPVPLSAVRAKLSQTFTEEPTEPIAVPL